MSRCVDLDERVTAQFYDEECEEWTMQTCTIADVLDSVCDEYTVLPSAQQWTPCGEKPDTDRNVFVARGTSDSMSVCVGHYDHGLEQWYEDRNWFAKCLYDGLYWCEMPPLPEPYKGES